MNDLKDILTPNSNAAQAASIKIEDQSSTDAPVTAAPAAALQDQTQRNTSPLNKLLALVPADKQAEASQYLFALLQDARETGEPIPPHKAKLAMGRGGKYRVSERAPVSERKQ